MKKTTSMIFLFLCSFMMCFLAACNGGFFETPSQETEQTPTENTDVTLKDEANTTETPQTAVTDETWNNLAISYANLENDYQALRSAYEADALRANPDVDALLEQANDLITTMGETKRSQIAESDALELQQVIETMDESINELYNNIISNEENASNESNAQIEQPGEQDTLSEEASSDINDADNSSTEDE